MLEQSFLFYPQNTPELALIKTDDDFCSSVDNWHSHLSSLVYHLSALLKIGRNVMFYKTNAVSFEECFGHIAIDARWC